MEGALRAGIAGYGVVGKRRQKFVNRRKDMKIVAVCDRKFQTSGEFEDGIKYYDYYKRLLDENLDALFVCISNDMAAEITIAGLERGLHVFCEKPPGRNLEDIEKVIACEKKYPKLKLKYGFNHRYHNSVRDALRTLNSGELGKVINLRGVYGKSQIVTFGKQSDWRTNRDLAGGGILLDQGIHMVDLLRLFSGDFVEVKSFISNGFWNHNVEDNAYALLRTTDGVVAMLHSSATQWRHRFSLEITLEKGTLILSGILSGTKSYGEETLTISRNIGDDRGNPNDEVISYKYDPSWEDEIEEFALAIIGNSKIKNGSSLEALKTMGLVYQIYCADSDWKNAWNLSDKT
ncbi:Gfo/Idh/MocA family oxidoreductase [Rhodospirillales bacterium]|nr:Gfo/Idh/MocA family oxidoreductase [Rhodospirillales bacterium]